MNELTKLINAKIAKECKQLRENAKLTMVDVARGIEKCVREGLRDSGWDEDKIEIYLLSADEDKENEEIIDELKEYGIEKKYERIASSTIGRYENCEIQIPAWYMEVLKKVCNEKI